jgi:translation initiation factor 3 subunit B
MFTNFELFRMRNRDIPIEHFETREKVNDFAWEPQGVRFGVVHSTIDTKASVSVYTMGSFGTGPDAKFEQLYSLTDRPCNKLYWSPVGRYCILAGQCSPHNGILEFYDLEENEQLNSVEHFMCTDVLWDPSGRFVASVVSQPMFGAASMRHQLENGYALWSFQGAPMYRKQAQSFYQFLWRPRPADVLTEEERAEVMKNMHLSVKRFKDQDKYLSNSRQAEDARNAIKLREAFRDLLKRRRAELETKRAEYVKLVGWDDRDDSLYDITVEECEEVLGEREILDE